MVRTIALQDSIALVVGQARQRSDVTVCVGNLLLLQCDCQQDDTSNDQPQRQPSQHKD